MRKLILKSAIFVAPFLLLHFINITFYKRNEGDLPRIGYLFSNPTPKSAIATKFSVPREFIFVSEIDFSKKPKFDVLTFGDSFSDQDSLGYQNFLEKKNVSVLHMDGFLAYNYHRIAEFITGDFFDSIRPDYVVLQSVERYFGRDNSLIDSSQAIHLNTIKKTIENRNPNVPNYDLDFFADTTLKIPYMNLHLLFADNPYFSTIYKVTTNTSTLFSGNPDNVLFFEEDIHRMSSNNLLSITNANDLVNKVSALLAKKGIKLIFFISPDKYDIYYPYIKDKRNYKKPRFFEHFNSLKKDYIYIDAYEILSEKIKEQKDIYYYDDSHWTPIAAELIAKEIKKKISEN